MSYHPSPRPVFDGPTYIPAESVKLHLWGDPESGQVSDEIYVSSDKVHHLVFSLPPGGAWRHSQNYRTVFAADEIYYVQSGVLVLNNPETGEVHRALPGDAIFFRRDTWHLGFNYSQQVLRVIEFFAPPPAKGTSSAYARTQPDLDQPLYFQNQWLEKWPMARSEATAKFTMQVVREADVLWRLEGAKQQALVGLLASTEHLTVGRMYLLPGQSTDLQVHRGDETLHVLDGQLSLWLPENKELQMVRAQAKRWLLYARGDAAPILQHGGPAGHVAICRSALLSLADGSCVESLRRTRSGAT